MSSMRPVFFPLLINFALFWLITACETQPPVSLAEEIPVSNEQMTAPLLAEIPVAYPDSLIQQKRLQYTAILKAARVQRIALAQQYQSAKTDSARRQILERARFYLRHTLLEEIFPAWHGTPWDFNGYSNVPGEGNIACGYFVSTPLKHMGVPLNRYRVAQQASSVIVNSLCDSSRIFRSYQALGDHLEQQSQSLFVVGLDNHVGFISKEVDGIFFIHSAFDIPAEVKKDRFKASDILQYSSIFVLGDLLGGQKMVRAWLTQRPISL